MQSNTAPGDSCRADVLTSVREGFTASAAAFAAAACRTRAWQPGEAGSLMWRSCVLPGLFDSVCGPAAGVERGL